MLHFSRWKIFSIVATIVAGIIICIPNFLSKETLAGLPSFFPKQQLSLGLDLRGGAHLLLAMDSDQIRKDWLGYLRDDVRKSLRDQKIGFTGIGVQGNALQVTLAKPEDTEKAYKELGKLAQPIGNMILGTSASDLDVRKGNETGTILLQPTTAGIKQRIANASGASIETIRRRVDPAGTSEITLIRQGEDRILLQVPGEKDTGRLKKILGETAKLTFHDVHPSMTPDEVAGTRAPIGYKVYEGAAGERSYVLREQPVVQGDDLVDSQPGFDQRTNEPIISFRFNQSGARKFGNFTKDNVGRPFAIVLDDKVLSAPVIREAILGGTGQISGNFTVESATNLAIQLRSGALPTKLTIVEERSVGPSLGADSISAGTSAFAIGCIATIILTIAAYGTFGIYAVLGLAVHAMLILAAMTLIGATLTLPGIAGFVLTIGMAVDANVLIYERIREELRAGKSPIAAIDAGFTRAFVTIADSQLTTLAAAAIMFWLGSGPIRGFAVTLTIGILTSVFSAVTVTRLLVALWLKNAKAKGRALQVPV